MTPLETWTVISSELNTVKVSNGDDRIGRALDWMHGSLLDIKAALIISSIKEFDISLSEIHTDITNVLFEGSYENLEEEQLHVTYGHTKKGQDSRCKQVNFSLSVSADGGVPIWYEALDGNTTDSVAYLPHLNVIKELLGIYVLRSNLKKEEYPMIEVFRSFKEQSTIERCFLNIKQPPICVSPLWLHKPERIESLLFCVFVAFLLWALLEREARKKVQPKGIPLRTEGRDNLPLTASVLLEAFDQVAIYTITKMVNGKIEITKRCGNLNVEQRNVLWTLSFPTINQFIDK